MQTKNIVITFYVTISRFSVVCYAFVFDLKSTVLNKNVF